MESHFDQIAGNRLKSSSIVEKGLKNGVQYAVIPGLDKPVSRILLGTASTPRDHTNEWLDEITQTGINTFDTARVYMNSEEVIGKWFCSGGKREDIVLLTKCCHPALFLKRVTARAMKADLAKSLDALHTDCIDIYLLHRDDPSRPVDEFVETFNEMHSKGQIKVFGGSNWSHQRIEAANEYAYKHSLIPFSVSSPNFGLGEQIGDTWGSDCITITGESGADARQWYRSSQMPVIAYSSLGRGLFSGRMKSNDTANVEKYMDKNARRGYAYPRNYERLRRCEELALDKGVSVPQIAMSWIFRQDMNMFAIVSTSKGSRMIENIAALNLQLTPEECRYLNLVSQTHRE